MADYIALKNLSASDLTFFERLYRAYRADQNTGNKSAQKCINLNSDVFIGQFYTGLDTIAATKGGEVRVGLTVLGPDAAGPYPLTRKITKGKRQARSDGRAPRPYKNWRLNGEFIYSPEYDLERYDQLQEHDLAIIAFDGDEAPTNVTMILLGQSSPRDSALHAVFLPLVPPPRNTMRALSVAEIDRALKDTNTGRDHPLYALADDVGLEVAFEDASLGGDSGRETLRRRRVARPVTPEELERAKRDAERTGVIGESLIDEYFSNIGDMEDYTWESGANAVAPYDFMATSKDGQFKVDVKSTRGAFNADFHISIGELADAAASSIPYYIYRVHSLTDDGAHFRASGDIRQFAKRILSIHDQAMPQGVRVDGFSVKIDVLTWGKEIQLSFREDDSDSSI